MYSPRIIGLVLLGRVSVSALVFSSGQPVANFTGNASAPWTSPGGGDPPDNPYALTFEQLVDEGFANVDHFFPFQRLSGQHSRQVLAINAFPVGEFGALASDYRHLRLLTHDYARRTLIQQENSHTITGLWFKPQRYSLGRQRTRLRLFSFAPGHEPPRIGLDQALRLLQLRHFLYGPWHEMRMVAFRVDPYASDADAGNKLTEVYYAFRVQDTLLERWWLVGSHTLRAFQIFEQLDSATDFHSEDANVGQ